MKNCLLLISLLFASLASHAQALQYDTDSLRRYNSTITFGKAALTGICLIKDVDGEVRGTIVNEFGIKALDFAYNKRRDKVKLQNVIKFMDRWYIKKVVKADIATLLRTENTQKQLRRRTLTVTPEGSVSLTNEKYNINYTFTPLTDATD